MPLRSVAGDRFYRSPLKTHGFSLIELMIAMAIGLLVMLSISMVMSTSEGKKRTLTSTNDIDQSGVYASYALDKLARSAGSGFYQMTSSLGCNLLAVDSGTQALPISGSLPNAFQYVTQKNFSLMPLLVLPKESWPSGNVASDVSDVLVIMEGTNGNNAVPTLFNGVPTSSSLNLYNTVGYSPNDIILVDDPTTPSGDCLIDQVDSGVTLNSGAVNLPLSGPWHAGDTFPAQPLSGMSINGASVDLGNYNNGTSPIFDLIGVGPNNTLYSYDLLTPGAAPVPVANGVFEMHVLYGIDNNGSGTANAWVSPTNYPGYTVASSSKAGLSNPAMIPNIKAVRIGLILRTQLQERVPSPPAPPYITQGPIVLFKNLTDPNGNSLQITRTLTGTEQDYRYRTFEFTVPLQNTLQ